MNKARFRRRANVAPNQIQNLCRHKYIWKETSEPGLGANNKRMSKRTEKGKFWYLKLVLTHILSLHVDTNERKETFQERNSRIKDNQRSQNQ